MLSELDPANAIHFRRFIAEFFYGAFKKIGGFKGKGKDELIYLVQL
jgi:hypothetical protein